MELGIYTFGDIVTDPATGQRVSPVERTRQMIALARLADEAGLDIMGVGEHHALRYVNSATATLIAAMAAVTRRIRFTSACTLIGTADPVRTFQEFATADLVSEGRVEIVFGRGAFLESFALFGHSLDDYDALFTEKLALFDRLNGQEKVSWAGRFRPPLHDAEIAPRPAQPRLPVWIGAGSMGSVARAAMLGLPLAIPMVGGHLANYAALADRYRAVWAGQGRDPAAARIALYSHLHVAASSSDLQEIFFPYYSAYLAPLFKGPMPRPIFDQMRAPEGALMAGSAQQVIDKLLLQHEATGMTRYLGQIDIGGQPFAAVAKSLERFAADVVPVVRRAVGGG